MVVVKLKVVAVAVDEVRVILDVVSVMLEVVSERELVVSVIEDVVSESELVETESELVVCVKLEVLRESELLVVVRVIDKVADVRLELVRVALADKLAVRLFVAVVVAINANGTGTELSDDCGRPSLSFGTLYKISPLLVISICSCFPDWSKTLEKVKVNVPPAAQKKRETLGVSATIDLR